MREIKFRAWDLNEDEYISWDRLIRTRYNQDYYTMNNQGDVILSMMTDKHIVLEQFTGLRDKNGKEIYEGDILLGLFGTRGKGALSRKEMPFKIQIIYIAPEFVFKRLEDRGNYLWYPSWKECEIIGNIHENPELLDK